MLYTVEVPFGPFDAGQEVTAADVLAQLPHADLDRLVRLRSLVPPAGAAALLVPAPVTAGEAELVADLQKRLEDAEADRDLERETAAALLAQRDALAKRVAELEAAAAKPKPAARAKADPVPASPAPPDPVPPAPVS